jgi:hypothetical protein
MDLKINLKQIFFLLVLVGYAFWTWSPVLNFGFLRAYEPLWLGSLVNRFSFIDLYQSHSYFYYLNYLLFGWDARGWYLTGIITHVIGSLSFIYVVRIALNEFKSDINADVFGFIFGLIFIGSYVYLDVVSWGSFNSYYGFLLFTISITVIQFFSYQKTGNKWMLLASCASFLVALLMRETAVLALILIATISLLKEWSGWHKTFLIELKKTAKLIIPFLLVLIIFLIFRKLVGGVLGDMNDENVRGRLNLIANQEYLELIRRIALTFFRNIATLALPFDWLNVQKAHYMSSGVSAWFFATYFFSTIGLIIFVIMTFAAYLGLRKNTPVGKLIIFSWVIVTASILIIAVAVPSIPEVLATDYNFFTRRYNYFAFLGISILFTIVFIKVSSWWIKSTIISTNILVFLVIFFLIWNHNILQKNLSLVYKNEHEKYLTFVSDFKKISPTFTESKFIYYPRTSPHINDFLLALNLTKSSIYKGTKDGNGNYGIIVYSEIDRVFQKLKEKKVTLDNVLFLIYSETMGLKNITDQVIPLYTNKINIPLRKNQSNDFEHFSFDSKLFAEIPFSISFDAIPKVISTVENSEFADFIDWYKTGKIKAGPTLQQHINEPYLYCEPKNAIDLNINNDFVWCADGYKSWIELGSHAKLDIFGLWLISPSRDVTPNQYEISYLDQDCDENCSFMDYKKIEFTEEIKPWGLQILFKDPINTKRLKLIIKNTYKNYPILSEVNVISKSIKNALNKGIEIPEVLQKILDTNSANQFWVSIDWVLTDGQIDIKKHKNFFVDLTRGQDSFSIPFTGSVLRDNPHEKFLKFRYKSVHVKIPKEAADKVINLKFNSTY